MNIDWSKAPEGATHYCLDATDGTHWRDLSRKQARYFYLGSWYEHHGVYSSELISGRIRLISRPSWTGEGLPPVGTVCEWQSAEGGQWFDCNILAHGRNGADWVAIAQNGYEVVQGCAKQYRPIRTPEQIAEEAQQSAITVIENRIMARMGDLNVRNLAEDLHALLQEMAVKP